MFRHYDTEFLPVLQVAIFCADAEGQRSRTIDAQLFQQLPKLNCLTIAGAPPRPHLPRGAMCSPQRSPRRQAPPLPRLCRPARCCAGHWGLLDTSQLPPRLKHLSLSNYSEHHAIMLQLPGGLQHLELLTLRADSVVCALGGAPAPPAARAYGRARLLTDRAC